MLRTRLCSAGPAAAELSAIPASSACVIMSLRLDEPPADITFQMTTPSRLSSKVMILLRTETGLPAFQRWHAGDSAHDCRAERAARLQEGCHGVCSINGRIGFRPRIFMPGITNDALLFRTACQLDARAGLRITGQLRWSLCGPLSVSADYRSMPPSATRGFVGIGIGPVRMGVNPHHQFYWGQTRLVPFSRSFYLGITRAILFLGWRAIYSRANGSAESQNVSIGSALGSPVSAPAKGEAHLLGYDWSVDFGLSFGSNFCEYPTGSREVAAPE